MISDQGGLFHSGAFADLLVGRNVKHRFGAVGKHGSISVIERVAKTLKHEWLHRVTLIKSIDHLQKLCNEFLVWYNEFRPHTHLRGATPQTSFTQTGWKYSLKDSKVVPIPVERVKFGEARTVALRLKRAE